MLKTLTPPDFRVIYLNVSVTSFDMTRKRAEKLLTTMVKLMSSPRTLFHRKAKFSLNSRLLSLIPQRDLTQHALTLAGVWFTGEYGDLLLHPCEALSPEEGVEGEEGVDGSAAEWAQQPAGARSDDKDGDSKSRLFVASRTGGVGAAFDAVEARDIVGLMAKIMKVSLHA